MDIDSLKSALAAHRGAVATGALVAVLAAGITWTVSSGPLVPGPAPAGSVAGSAMGSSAPAPAGSSLPAGQSGAADAAGTAAEGDGGHRDAENRDGSPSDGGAGEDGAGAGEADGSSPTGGKPSGGRGGGRKPQHQASAPEPEGHGQGAAPAPQGPAPEPQRPSKPAHSHSWAAVYREEPVYGQRWVPKWEDVFIRRQGCFTCNGCGAQFPTVSAFEDHSDAAIDNGDLSHGGYTDDSYDVWEKRDNGSYQTVQTGTEKVLDHYECACGARK